MKKNLNDADALHSPAFRVRTTSWSCQNCCYYNNGWCTANRCWVSPQKTPCNHFPPDTLR